MCIRDRDKGEAFGWDVTEVQGGASAPGRIVDPTWVAVSYTHLDVYKRQSDALVDGRCPCYASNVERFLGWLAALAADGYEPTAADIDLKSLCESALAHDEDEEE